jgi:glycine/D-amino acid oxidase-like deaminating enzyme
LTWHLQKFGVNELVAGAISYKAGALWPYRLVTGIWKKLLDEFPDLLSIETETPATAISVDSTPDFEDEPSIYPYSVTTPRGTIRARHVVHATNAYATSLLPGLVGKMAGAVAHMTAQQPGAAFPGRDGTRSWSLFFGRDSFDYVTQRPPAPDGSPGELMVGGGFFQSPDQGLDLTCVYGDDRLDALTAAHLQGVMPTFFAPRWGEEGKGGRVKNAWSGVIGISADFVPFVGRLDRRVTQRSLPDEMGDADAGEWISAAYTGDGMVWAWLCGTALGVMIAGKADADLPAEPGRPAGKLSSWFEPELLATPERIRRIDIADLANMVM